MLARQLDRLFNTLLGALLQDDDGHLLRLQPADPEPPGRTGVAGWQRLGRHGARAGGGVHPAQSSGHRSARLFRADHQHLAAHGDAGDLPAGDVTAPPQLARAADGHPARVGRRQHQGTR